MLKKGQISIFILLGVILIVAVGFLLFVNNSEEENEVETSIAQSFDNSFIRTYTDSCLKNTAESGLILIGNRGGYYKLNKYTFNFFNNEIPYYFYLYADNYPNEDYIEQQISLYIKDNINSCLKNLSIMENYGYQIDFKEIAISTNINEKDISIKMIYPVELVKNNNKQIIEEFNIKIGKFELKKIIQTSQKITDLFVQDSKNLCISCITQISEDSGLYISIFDAPNATIVFNLMEYNNTFVKPYNFTFAVKYTGYSCSDLSGVLDESILDACLNIEKEKLKENT